MVLLFISVLLKMLLRFWLILLKMMPWLLELLPWLLEFLLQLLEIWLQLLRQSLKLKIGLSHSASDHQHNQRDNLTSSSGHSPSSPGEAGVQGRFYSGPHRPLPGSHAPPPPPPPSQSPPATSSSCPSLPSQYITLH